MCAREQATPARDARRENRHLCAALLLSLLRSKRYRKHNISTDPCGPWQHGRQRAACSVHAACSPRQPGSCRLTQTLASRAAVVVGLAELALHRACAWLTSAARFVSARVGATEGRPGRVKSGHLAQLPTWRPRAAFWAGITTINRLTRRAAPAPETGGGVA